ncbi:MAG: hypothetical protein ACPGLV_17050 [Bacteroidia bacterium]
MTFQGWVDLFTREVYRELFVGALKHCHIEKGLIIHEYVIMSNHAHLILQHRGSRLSGVIRDFKAHVAREVLKCLKTDNPMLARATKPLARCLWLVPPSGWCEL